MSSTQRARRMARNHKRLARPAKLNLVALMDIFTILVLFLIVNNGDVEVLQLDKKLTLPESVSEQRPKTTIVIKITATEILLAGELIGTVEEALAEPEGPLDELSSALLAAATANEHDVIADTDEARPIIIMGDRSTPYALLKRIMATCAETDYREISLAVNSIDITATPASDPALALSGTGLGINP